MITLGTGLAVLGGALALGVAGVSTALGVQAAGYAGAGAVAENKEHFKNSLILQAMPQTQTIYAFITVLLIAMGVGLLGGPQKDITTAQGLVFFAVGLVVAITSTSAITQGNIAAAGIISCTKNKDAFTPSLVFAGQSETPAIFGFITALIILIVGLAVLG